MLFSKIINKIKIPFTNPPQQKAHAKHHSLEKSAKQGFHHNPTDEIQQITDSYFHLLVENMVDAIWLVDKDLKTIYINPSVTQLRDFSLEDLNSIPLDQQMTSESYIRVMNLFKDMLDPKKHAKSNDKVTATIELELYKKDKSRYWSENHFVLIRDEYGKPEYILAGGRDITDIKFSINALRESEDRYRSTLDNMMEGCQIIGFDWKYLYLNNAAEIHNRCPNEKLIGNRYMDMWPGIENTEVFHIIKNCMEERVFHHIENEFIFPDGNKGWFDLSIQPVSEGVFILSIDITERKNAENELRIAHEHLRRFVDSNIVGVVIANSEGKIIETNDYYLNMIGFSREEYDCGIVDWRAITPPEWLPADEKAIEELRKYGKCIPYEKEYIKRDGNRVAVYLMDALLPGPEEQIAAFALDISERKQTEKALRLSEELFSSAFRSSPYAITLTRPQDGKIVEVNDSFYLMSGYTHEDIENQTTLSLDLWVNTEDRNFVVNQLQMGEKVMGKEFQFRKKNGEVFNGMFSASSIKLKDEMLILSSINDINDRKVTEAKLTEQLIELERWQSVTMGREMRIIELKREINMLLKQLNQQPRYHIPESKVSIMNG